jgi:hypothetical protein
MGRRGMHIGWESQTGSLGRPRHSWLDNIKMNLAETEWGGMDWISLGQDRDQWRALVNTVINLWVL